MVIMDIRMFSVVTQVNWLYQLTVACSGGWSCKTGSDFEQLISQLMATDGDCGSRQWHDPVMLHSKDIVLHRPLTCLHSDDLQRKASEMFKVCVLRSSKDLLNIFLFSSSLFLPKLLYRAAVEQHRFTKMVVGRGQKRCRLANID